MPKTKIPLTPEGRLELAKRYLKNAKEELRKAGIDRVVGRYIDLKHISSACGIAYLVALEALKALFISKGLISSEELNQRLKKVEGYYKGLKEIKGLGKDRDIGSKAHKRKRYLLHGMKNIYSLSMTAKSCPLPTFTPLETYTCLTTPSIFAFNWVLIFIASIVITVSPL